MVRQGPALSNEQNIEQLRASLALARDAYLAAGENTAFGHWIDNYGPQIAIGATRGMNSLTACYGRRSSTAPCSTRCAARSAFRFTRRSAPICPEFRRQAGRPTWRRSTWTIFFRSFRLRRRSRPATPSACWTR